MVFWYDMKYRISKMCLLRADEFMLRTTPDFPITNKSDRSIKYIKSNTECLEDAERKLSWKVSADSLGLDILYLIR